MYIKIVSIIDTIMQMLSINITNLGKTFKFEI
jgi:hypothetical protein